MPNQFITSNPSLRAEIESLPEQIQTLYIESKHDFGCAATGNDQLSALNKIYEAATRGHPLAKVWMGFAYRTLVLNPDYDPPWCPNHCWEESMFVNSKGWFREYEADRAKDDNDHTKHLDKAKEKEIWSGIAEAVSGKSSSLTLGKLLMCAVPPEIGLASRLTFVNLSGNKLKSLPNEIGCCEFLEELCCPDNFLTELPAQLSNCQRLHTINICNNKLTEISSVLGKLPNLTCLRCSHNLLKGLSDEISNCCKLEYIDCSDNQPGFHIPTSIFVKCKSLFRVECRGNQLTALPDEVGTPRLNMLDCSRNALTQLPESLSKCIELGALDCSSNLLEELPARLGDCKQIKSIRCAANRLSNIPGGVGCFTKVIHLDASNNRLSSLPVGFEGWEDLERIELDGNKFESLPEGIGSWKSLKRLSVEHNQLKSLPISIGMCQNLQVLLLDYNHDFYVLPPELSECENLKLISCVGCVDIVLSETLAAIKGLGMNLDSTLRPKGGLLGTRARNRMALKALKEAGVRLEFTKREK